MKCGGVSSIRERRTLPPDGVGSLGQQQPSVVVPRIASRLIASRVLLLFFLFCFFVASLAAAVAIWELMRTVPWYKEALTRYAKGVGDSIVTPPAQALMLTSPLTVALTPALA